MSNNTKEQLHKKMVLGASVLQIEEDIDRIERRGNCELIAFMERTSLIGVKPYDEFTTRVVNILDNLSAVVLDYLNERREELTKEFEAL